MLVCYYIHANSLFIFLKIVMVTSQARFKWTDEKLINLIKRLQEFKTSMEIAAQTLTKSNYMKTSEKA